MNQQNTGKPKQKPLLHRTDAWSFYALMFGICLISPIVIIFLFASIAHFVGGAPWPKLWQDMGAMAGVYSGLVAAITLLFGISSLIKSRQDKAWDDQFYIQEQLYRMNREWVEDEIRLITTKNDEIKKSIINAKHKCKSSNLETAYRSMILSGSKLREISKKRAEHVGWDLIDCKDSKDGSSSEYDSILRVHISKKSNPSIDFQTEIEKITKHGLFRAKIEIIRGQEILQLEWPKTPIQSEEINTANPPSSDVLLNIIKSIECYNEPKIYCSRNRGCGLKFSKPNEHQYKIEIDPNKNNMFFFLDEKIKKTEQPNSFIIEDTTNEH